MSSKTRGHSRAWDWLGIHEVALEEGQAVLFEDGNQEGAAVTEKRVAHPDGEEDADGDVDEVVDQSQFHVYHPSSEGGFEHVQL